MGRNKNTYSENLKRKVTTEALKEEQTLQEISVKFGVPVSTIATWKKESPNREAISSRKAKMYERKCKEYEKELQEAYAIIGKEKMKVELLKKKLNL